MSKGKFYMTTAIAYASGKPHIGNTYEAVLADSIARFKRKDGYDVFFQTGTDEHGQKIELKAAEAGVTPQEYVDKASAEIKRIWDLMGTSYDKFIRTTEPDHEKQVQKIFKRLYDQGDIYKGSYEGMYCTPCESFWTQSVKGRKMSGLRQRSETCKGRSIFLQNEQICAAPDRPYQQPSGIYPAGIPQKRDDEQFPASRTAGSVRFQNLFQMGYPG